MGEFYRGVIPCRWCGAGSTCRGSGATYACDLHAHRVPLDARLVRLPDPGRIQASAHPLVSTLPLTNQDAPVDSVSVKEGAP